MRLYHLSPIRLRGVLLAKHKQNLRSSLFWDLTLRNIAEERRCHFTLWRDLKSRQGNFIGPDVEMCNIHRKSFPSRNLQSPANRRSVSCGDEKESSNKLSSIDEFLVFRMRFH